MKFFNPFFLLHMLIIVYVVTCQDGVSDSPEYYNDDIPGPDIGFLPEDNPQNPNFDYGLGPA
ncbi:unnamed protein product [Acanthoscelides obtectus]|uniref:Uncharacterized protein n=1 Tax=Acanthoscelides obtectus TaxID=200917 RepID=A0A9P0LZ20_ACAOB|nr:unnamed protein product [Acanthoscelides obtectus]CAK1664893.1 hypothetical protein AOBTE_LOCUS24530 [Acanthoscelides obtectus]